MKLKNLLPYMEDPDIIIKIKYKLNPKPTKQWYNIKENKLDWWSFSSTKYIPVDIDIKEYEVLNIGYAYSSEYSYDAEPSVAITVEYKANAVVEVDSDE